MKLYRAIAIGLIAALCAVFTANAQQYIASPFVNLASPSALQTGDRVLCARGGISYNCTWPATLGSFPIATASTVGLAKPGSGMTVDGFGALSVTTTSGSFMVTLGTTTTANPWISGNVTSGFYSPGSNIAGIELNHVAAMQWNTLSSGVDYINITPGKSGTNPLISVGGSTANQGLRLSATGSGTITVNGVVFGSSSNISTGQWNGTAIAVGYGGTGLTGTPASNQILIGNGSGYLLSTLTGGTGVSITTTGATTTITSASILGSITTANPSISGTTSSGFFAASTTEADIAIGGNNIAGWTTSGQNINTGYLALTATSASSPAYGIYSPVTGRTVLMAGSQQLLTLNSIASGVNGLAINESVSGSAISLTATGSDTNITEQLNGKGTGGAALQGTGTANNAAAGYVGEYLSATITGGSAVSLVSNTGKQVTAIGLTAGDWEVSAELEFTGGASTTLTYLQGLISTTSNSVADSQFGYASTFISNTGSTTAFNAVSPITISIPSTRAALAATTTYYLNAICNFGVSTCSAYGGIQARRLR